MFLKNQMRNEKIIEKIELELLLNSVDYRVSSIDRKIWGFSYQIDAPYHGNYPIKQPNSSYSEYAKQLKRYILQHIESKEDTSNRVPLKWLNILPESQMGGVLGFTYLGENFMGRRADLTGRIASKVDIHESIHTSDEYETRCLTLWIMSKERSKYIR